MKSITKDDAKVPFRELQKIGAVGRKECSDTREKWWCARYLWGFRKKEPTDSKWHAAVGLKMNRSFRVKLEGNERLRGTKRRYLSSDARGPDTTTTRSLNSALWLPFSLLAYCPFTVPSPHPTSAEIKDSWICRQRTGTPIVHMMSPCPSSLEASGCEDIAFCMHTNLSQSTSLWLSGLCDKFSTLEPALRSIKYLQWGRWLVFRLLSIVFMIEILVNIQYLDPPKQKLTHLLQIHFWGLIIHSCIYSTN